MELLLQQAVGAEAIFEGGAGDPEGREDSEGLETLNLLNLEGPKLNPTPEGLPDPHAQQALLHPVGSQHSPLERRARNAHAKALGVAAMSAPAPASSSSASRGQVALQPNFTALIECCCGSSSVIAAESIKAGLKTIRLTADSNPIGTDAGDAASHAIVEELAAENHKIHLWGSLPCTVWSQYTELNLRRLGPRFRGSRKKA